MIFALGLKPLVWRNVGRYFESFFREKQAYSIQIVLSKKNSLDVRLFLINGCADLFAGPKVFQKCEIQSIRLPLNAKG
jgi:hypothetical protein